MPFVVSPSGVIQSQGQNLDVRSRSTSPVDQRASREGRRSLDDVEPQRNYYPSAERYTEINQARSKTTMSADAFGLTDEERGRVQSKVQETVEKIIDRVADDLKKSSGKEIKADDYDRFHIKLANDPAYHQKVADRQKAEQEFVYATKMAAVEAEKPKTKTVREVTDEGITNAYGVNEATGRTTSGTWATLSDPVAPKAAKYEKALKEELAHSAGLKKGWFGYHTQQ